MVKVEARQEKTEEDEEEDAEVEAEADAEAEEEEEDYMELYVQKELKDKIEPLQELFKAKQEESKTLVDKVEQLNSQIVTVDKHYNTNNGKFQNKAAGSQDLLK